MNIKVTNLSNGEESIKDHKKLVKKLVEKVVFKNFGNISAFFVSIFVLETGKGRRIRKSRPKKNEK